MFTKYILALVVAIVAVGWYASTLSDNLINPSDVESYVRENIASLSPRDEVLGGVFFVTKIDVGNDGTGTVEYEDGHNAYTADFTFETGGDEVEITSFVVRK